MKALFIGHSYIDVTFVTDVMPTGDDKALGKDYAFGIGGNAMVAAFTCAKFGIKPDLLIPIAPDWLGDMMQQKCEQAGIRVHSRGVGKSSLSLVMPNDGKRAILRCRDNRYTTDFPHFDLSGCKALHLDGHQPDAALHYAKLCREKGILTSYDGGAVRPGTEDLMPYVDVAVVSMRFCEQLEKSPTDTLAWLKNAGVKVAAVTMGDQGMVYQQDGPIHTQGAIPLAPAAIVDSTGAGDIFHGAYVFSYLRHPDRTWAEHFAFARAASTLSIQRLGTEASIPTLAEVDALLRQYPAQAA